MEDPESPNNIGCCGFNCCKRNKSTPLQMAQSCAAQKPKTTDQPQTQKPCTAENEAAFCGDLPQPLLPGYCIKVIGTPLDTCDRFSINFLCGEGDNSDIAFHFNPRLVENYVVRNSRRNGKWEHEETTSHRQPNLRRNVPFCISFFIAPKEFMVAINDNHFCVFQFRIPLQRANLIDVQGDVHKIDVELKELTAYPNPKLIVKKMKPLPFSDVYDGETALPNPFIGHMDRGFESGWQLEIHGKVKLLPDSFFINLQEGNSLWPHPRIPLHLNARFNTSRHNSVLIRNAWGNGPSTWGPEERSHAFYFAPSKAFRLVIQLDIDRELFIVWVNSYLQGEFHIRSMFTAKSIDTLYIQGDITIYKVFMKEKFSSVLENIEDEI